MNPILIVRRVLAAFATAAAVAIAAHPAMAQMPNQVPLTTAKVEAVIASYPVVRQTADGLEAQYGDVGGGSDPATAFGAWLAVGAANGALNGAVQSYGFADFSDWVGTMTSVVMAYSFARQGGNANAQMAEAMAQIQNNPNLTDAQRQMMLQQLQASMGALAMMQPSQENIDAVTPYVDQLQGLFDD